MLEVLVIVLFGEIAEDVLSDASWLRLCARDKFFH